MKHKPDAETLVAPAAICDAIRGGHKVALAGHVTPDGDCVGAIGALWLALPELDITPLAVLPPETVARRLNYLVHQAGLQAATPEQLRGCDLLIAVDTAKEPRLNIPGGLDTVQGIPICNIDHHATNTQYGKWNWTSGERSSTSEMIYELLRALGCQVTPTIATLLYAGIHTDTQGFSLVNATPRSLQVAADLSAAGARVQEVCEQLHRSHSPSEFALLKVVYGNTNLSDDGRVAWSSASYDEIHDAGCNANDIDDQVEIPRSIEGVNIALLLSEGNRGKVRVNFRGERGLSVLELARQFKGGGHHASAGAIVDGDITEVSQRVLAAAHAYLDANLTESPAS
ncbi:MAG: bifunctional oligoribonuclease/PAP phosphatase NrnA [Phycisphaerae bacterium]|nr:bifunctional oligoribonuclease/PAP phosphatase NrnA [Phycisphaerae bacterium]